MLAVIGKIITLLGSLLGLRPMVTDLVLKRHNQIKNCCGNPKAFIIFLYTVPANFGSILLALLAIKDVNEFVNSYQLEVCKKKQRFV